VLQRDSARYQKLRRSVETFPVLPALRTGGYAPAFFERRANEKDSQLARNAVSDARSDLKEDPTRDNFALLRNARDNVKQADARRDANTFDLLGSSANGAGRFAGVFRKKASQTKLDSGYRSLRLAQQEYAKNPTEINRMNVQLANLYIDATLQEDDGNTNEITGTIAGLNANAKALNTILFWKNFQDESNLWLRYDRLARKILIAQQKADAKDKASSTDEQDSVSNRMLGMSMYGSQFESGPSRGGQ